MRKNLKKVLSIVMILTMVFAMSSVAFAADTDPNLTFLENAQARTEYQLSSITSDTTLKLKAVPADYYWSATSFDTEAVAEAVVWTSTNDNMASVTSVDAVALDNGGYYSEATIAIKSTAGAGACSIKAAKGSAYVNFTIVIEDSQNAANNTASNISVYINDARYETMLSVAKTGVTATLPTAATNPFYSATFKADTYSTPAYALAAIKNPNGVYDEENWTADYVTNFTIFASTQTSLPTTYVDTITTDVMNAETFEVENVTFDPYYTANYDYYGWHYRVLRNGSVLEESKVIGAADFKLNTNDTVYWLFGTESQVDDFMSEVSANN